MSLGLACGSRDGGAHSHKDDPCWKRWKTHLRWKVNPLVEFTDGDIERYMELRNLPRHPLQARGYVSVGDAHSTTPLGPGMRAEDSRHGGTKRECGIHLSRVGARGVVGGSNGEDRQFG